MRQVLLIGLVAVACGGGTAASVNEKTTGSAGEQSSAGEGVTHTRGGSVSHGGSTAAPSAGAGGDGGSWSVADGGGAGVPMGPDAPATEGGVGGAENATTERGGAGAGGAGGVGGSQPEDVVTNAGAAGEPPQVEPWKICDGGKICAADEVCAHDTPTHRVCAKINDQFGHCDPTTLPNPNTELAHACEGKSEACSTMYYKCGMMDDPASGKGCGLVSGVPYPGTWYCGPPL